ncbi:hypothetical protein BDW75DRAFT_216149 [Aspergillus navahoensis]
MSDACTTRNYSNNHYAAKSMSVGSKFSCARGTHSIRDFRLGERKKKRGEGAKFQVFVEQQPCYTRSAMLPTSSSFPQPVYHTVPPVSHPRLMLVGHVLLRHSLDIHCHPIFMAGATGAGVGKNVSSVVVGRIIKGCPVRLLSKAVLPAPKPTSYFGYGLP